MISYTLNGAQLIQLWQYYVRAAPVIKHVVRLAMWTRAAVIEQQPQDNIAQDEFLGVRGSAKQCIRRHVNDQRGRRTGWYDSANHVNVATLLSIARTERCLKYCAI